MTTTAQHSATIYQFPLRGRFAQPSVRADTRNDLDARRPKTVAADSSWYHDEAIREELARRH